MAERKQRVILPHSSVADKMPSVEDSFIGELYINGASGDGKTFLSTKKADNTMVAFHEDEYWEEYIAEAISGSEKELISDNVLINEDITLSGATLVSSGDSLTDAMNNTLTTILEDEKVTSTALNRMNENIASLSGAAEEEITKLKDETVPIGETGDSETAVTYYGIKQNLMTYDMRQTLWNLIQLVAYSTDEITDTINAFKTAWDIDRPTPKSLVSISAEYTGGNVYEGREVSGLTGVTVTAHYSDETSEEVSGYTMTKDPSKIVVGINIVFVEYEGLTTIFTVTGIASKGDIQYITATYTGGDVPTGTEIDELSGITVNAVYKDASVEEVYDYTLSGKTISEGTNVITVIYSAFTTTFNVTGVGEKVLTAITATYTGGTVPAGTLPSALSANTVVEAFYNDDSNEAVTGYILNGTIVEGSSTIYVKYNTCYTTFNVIGTASTLSFASLHTPFTTTSDAPMVYSIGDYDIDDTHYIEANIDVSECGQIAGYCCFALGISSTLNNWATGNLYAFPIAASSVLRFQAVYASGAVNADFPWNNDLKTINLKIKTDGLYINNVKYCQNLTNWTTFITKLNAGTNLYIGAGYLNTNTNDYPVITYKNIYYVTDSSTTE